MAARRSARRRLGEQLGRDPGRVAVAPGDRAAIKAEQVDVLELEPLDLLGLGEHDLAGRRGGRIVGVELARVGDRGQVANEVPHRAAGLTARPRGRELREAREALQPLGGLRGGDEEPMATQPDALDQAPHEDVRPHLLQRRRRGVVELQERLDPVAGLGRQLGALEGRLERRDHVQLATPGDRGAARQIDRAKLDRRPGHRPHDRRRVGRIGEHPQPGEHVADLGPLEERGVAGEAERHPALLERRGHQARLAPAGADDHADGLGPHLAGREQVLDLPRRRLGLGALAAAAPEPNSAGSLASGSASAVGGFGRDGAAGSLGSYRDFVASPAGAPWPGLHCGWRGRSRGRSGGAGRGRPARRRGGCP